jgi:hypothetical protein
LLSLQQVKNRDLFTDDCIRLESTSRKYFSPNVDGSIISGYDSLPLRFD